ncbi:MAG: CNNM domain-containing protein [Pseudomonadales bacterium]|jgi:CBS domain containing-hemolysin-like protein
MEGWIWIGILACLSQSAMFSGLNLAFFGLSRLELEAEAATSTRARRVLSLRVDSNFLLTTILWGNVSVNVLLTLLSDSVLAGAFAFLFSTVVITFFGEIIPQAYFSRNSLRMASLLAPLLRMYQLLLFPVAKPTAMMLDAWLGKETPQFFREGVIRDILLRHIQDADSEVDVIEGMGALNFLAIDELAATEEGEIIDPGSIVSVRAVGKEPQFPEFNRHPEDPFLRKLGSSGRKWVVLTDERTHQPLLLLDVDSFLRSVFFDVARPDPLAHCHRPIVVGPETSLDEVFAKLRRSKKTRRGVIEHDAVLVWGRTPRIITGADLFDRLLEGIH